VEARVDSYTRKEVALVEQPTLARLLEVLNHAFGHFNDYRIT
jgi:hypothetical protein